MDRAQLKKKKIAVLMGGLSGERDVSLRTGAAVLKALLGAGYQAVGIDAGHDLPARIAAEGIEVAFIALHGRYGEDGCVQGLLEMMGVPYTGSGVLASSLPTPGFEVFRVDDETEEIIARGRNFPLVVKPSSEGSTLGVTIAHNAEELRRGIDEARRFEGRILVEDFIPGSELTVGVLDGQALPVIEIVAAEGFYDYQAKYTAGRTEYLLPAPLEKSLANRLQETAVRACAAVGCRGAVRADFRLDGQKFYCLEINTIPGMTETSLLPKAAAAAGVDFTELVERILAGADLGH
jgi:D-alanine-D-alanine ligase